MSGLSGTLLCWLMITVVFTFTCLGLIAVAQNFNVTDETGYHEAVASMVEEQPRLKPVLRIAMSDGRLTSAEYHMLRDEYLSLKFNDIAK